MKTNTIIRSMAAIAAVIFAIAATGCQKENEITPNPGNGVITPPIVVPGVNMKPKKITTTDGGVVEYEEFYTYDSQNHLLLYLKKKNHLSDSVRIKSGFVDIITNSGGLIYKETLTLNPDKTFKHIAQKDPNGGNIEFDCLNSQIKLSRIVRLRANTTPKTILVANYLTNPDIAEIQVEESKYIISYYNNLPYQKGINEISGEFYSLRYFKVMEQEDATTMFLYNKLIKNITLVSNSSLIREVHDFTYEFDSSNRVTVVKETIRMNFSSNTPSRTTLIHTYSY